MLMLMNLNTDQWDRRKRLLVLIVLTFAALC